MAYVGKIAVINPVEYTLENLPTGVKPVAEKALSVCSEIDLKLYPSDEALDHRNQTIDEDEIVLIVGEAGRPNAFQPGDMWSCYDVMQIFSKGQIYECFRSSLKILTV